jgi:hypothetical protein
MTESKFNDPEAEQSADVAEPANLQVDEIEQAILSRRDQLPESSGPSGVTQPVAVGDRGFFSQKPCFTPEIERTAKQIARWLTLDRPGALIIGLNRIGKSFASRYLAEAIEQMLGGSTMVVLWPLKSADKGDVDFLKQRLDDIGARDYNHNQKGELARRLTKHILGRAQARNYARVLILIDEGQVITESQFFIVCDIQESLSKHHAVFTAFIGQPELKTLGETFKAKEAKNLVSRYFKLTHQMRGIAIKDIGLVLERLDTTTGSSVVQRHLPKLYDDGWRLEHIAPALKQAVESMRLDAKISSVVRLPMEDLRGAVNGLLYRMAAYADGDPRKFVRKSVLVACLKEVCFHEYIHLYVED